MSVDNDEWLIESVELVDGGKGLKVQFVHRFDTRWRHMMQTSADKWFRGQFAEYKLAELQKSLQQSFSILEGRT